VLRELKKGDLGDGVKAFTLENVEWYQDVDVATNVLIYVGAKFDVSYRVACNDFTFNYGSLPTGLDYPIVDTVDYETTRAGLPNTKIFEMNAGEIRMFAGATAPTGWALCDGAILNIEGNEALFDAIGDTYGGDGETTFAVPDLRGRVVMGVGTGTGLTARALAATVGTETHQLTVNEMPQHSHQFQPMIADENGGATDDPEGVYWGQSGADAFDELPFRGGGSAFGLYNEGEAVLNKGGDAAHNNIQPSIALNYIIALRTV